MRDMECFAAVDVPVWFSKLAGEKSARAAIRFLEGLGNLDGEALFARLEKDNTGKPLAMLRGLHNEMLAADKYSAPVMVWLYNELTPHRSYVSDSVDSNTILQCNVINKLQKLVKLPNFEWSILTVSDNSDDLDRLESLLTKGLAAEDAIFAMQNDLDVDDVRRYKKGLASGTLAKTDKIDKTTITAAVMRFCDNTLDYDIPLAALSAMYVLRELGIPVDRIADHEAMYHYRSFWYETLQLHDVIFEVDDDTITKEHLDNLQHLTDLLMGNKDIWRYGDDPIMSLLMEKTRAFKGLANRFTVEQRSAPLSTSRRYYLNTTKSSVRLFESDACYLWGNINNYLNGIFSSPRLANADIRKVDQEMIVNFITIDTVSINTDHYLDKYVSVADTLVKFGFERLMEILGPMYTIGRQLSCYNWNLLYVIYVLVKKNLPYKEWVRIYMGDSAAFSTFILNAVFSMMFGSADYEDLFSKGAEGFRQMRACYQTISPNYNFATAAIIFLLTNLKIDCSDLPRTRTLASEFTLNYRGTAKEFTVEDVASGLAQRQLYLLVRSQCVFSITDNKLIITVVER